MAETTSTPSNPIKTIYALLKSAGLTRSYVKKVALPDWWQDDLAKVPSAYAEALTVLARNLNVDLASLQRDGSVVSRFTAAQVKFKRRDDVTDEQIKWVRDISVRAAQLAAYAMGDRPCHSWPQAAALRQTILQQSSACVGFEDLLELCWQSGIPVLHVSNFPDGTKKMDGLALSIRGRPVIILSNKRRSLAWQLFILAHELGHVGLGHVNENILVVDGDGTWRQDVDSEENQANRFALEVLTGDPDSRFDPPSIWAPKILLQSARLAGRSGVDPGVVLLNYAWHNKQLGKAAFSVPMSALRSLEEDQDALTLISVKMQRHLDLECLPEESRDFLLRITKPPTE